MPRSDERAERVQIVGLTDGRERDARVLPIGDERHEPRPNTRCEIGRQPLEGALDGGRQGQGRRHVPIVEAKFSTMAAMRLRVAQSRLLRRRHRAAESAGRPQEQSLARSARHRHDVRQRRLVGATARRAGRAAARRRAQVRAGARAQRAEAREILLARLPMLEHQRLAGHTGGNLLLSMMEQYTGDFLAAVDGLRDAARLPRPRLADHGRARPRSAPDTATDRRRAASSKSTRDRHAAASVERLWLDPPVSIHRTVAETIRSLDAVVIGPGSFYTSLLPIFLVEGCREALAAVRGPVIYIANLLTEGRGMDGFTAGHAVDRLGRGHRPAGRRRARQRRSAQMARCSSATRASTKRRCRSGRCRRDARWWKARSGAARSRATTAGACGRRSGRCWRKAPAARIGSDPAKPAGGGLRLVDWRPRRFTSSFSLVAVQVASPAWPRSAVAAHGLAVRRHFAGERHLDVLAFDGHRQPELDRAALQRALERKGPVAPRVGAGQLLAVLLELSRGVEMPMAIFSVMAHLPVNVGRIFSFLRRVANPSAARADCCPCSPATRAPRPAPCVHAVRFIVALRFRRGSRRRDACLVGAVQRAAAAFRDLVVVVASPLVVSLERAAFSMISASSAPVSPPPPAGWSARCPGCRPRESRGNPGRS